MMVTEAIESRSSPASPASSILFVLWSRPLHRAPLEAAALSWPLCGEFTEEEVIVGVLASDLWLASESLFWLLDITTRPQPPRPRPLPRPFEERADLNELSSSSLDLISSTNFFSSSLTSFWSKTK